MRALAHSYNGAPQTTTTYDLLGRPATMSDADLGAGWQYTYDPNGNQTSVIDPRGAANGGAVYAGYDGLNRQLWRNTTNSPTGAYVTDTYDETTAHGYGIGRLTSESFTGGDANEPLHGSYSSYYGARGEITHFTLTTTEGTGYGLSYSYNDAMEPTSLTYSDGEVFSPQYNSDGWLTAATTTPSGGSQVNLLTNVSYSGTGGAAGHLTGANLGNGTYALSASYDDALQFTSLTLTNISQGTTVFSTQRGYDPVGVVTSVNTTLANGTDNQVFCYDSLNHLVWAGSTGTPNCARTLTPGTLTSAQYTATYAYDATNRITGGSLGTLSYGDSSHFHAATSSTSGETASYDAAGDMQCRARTSAVTCAGTTPTGASLNYDAERRLTHWQNAQSNPTVQAWYLYDGSGARVEQYVSGGSGNHTYYLPGGVEEVTPSGSLIKYYSAGGMTLGLNTARDASGISYLASDGLGSVSEALSPSGTATGAVLYSPYGGVRYATGSMPTSKGFTGQYADTASSGLDYYGARYYDPGLGQFTSADTANDGINRYGYVKGNPETATDPSGHRLCSEDGCGDGGGGYGGIVGGRGGPADTLYYWYRLMHGTNNNPIQRTIQLGGGAAVTIWLTEGNLWVVYQDGVSTPTWFDATGTPVQDAWLTVLSQHMTGGAPTGPVRPGRMGVQATAGFTPLERAQAIANYFGVTDPPTLTDNGRGYTTQLRLRGPNGQPAVVNVRSMDVSVDPAYSANGPYFRAYVERGGPGGYMGFDGAQNPDAHFYLGTDGEANDLMLQVAMVGTILYQRYG